MFVSDTNEFWIVFHHLKHDIDLLPQGVGVDQGQLEGNRVGAEEGTGLQKRGILVHQYYTALIFTLLALLFGSFDSLYQVGVEARTHKQRFRICVTVIIYWYCSTLRGNCQIRYTSDKLAWRCVCRKVKLGQHWSLTDVIKRIHNSEAQGGVCLITD